MPAWIDGTLRRIDDATVICRDIAGVVPWASPTA
jgi:hypothetical protein